MNIYRPPKECKTCKTELTNDGTIAKAWGYCDACYPKLTNGPEMHAEDYKKRRKVNQSNFIKLVEIEP